MSEFLDLIYVATFLSWWTRAVCAPDMLQTCFVSVHSPLESSIINMWIFFSGFRVEN